MKKGAPDMRICEEEEETSARRKELRMGAGMDCETLMEEGRD